MKKKNLGIEIIVILLVFIFSISILTRAFVLADSRGKKAARLSDAVTLASNCADVWLSFEEKEEVYKILNEKDNCENNEKLTAYYDDDLRPSANGPFKAVIEEEKEDKYINAVITIFYNEEEIYVIETGKGIRQ